MYTRMYMPIIMYSQLSVHVCMKWHEKGDVSSSLLLQQEDYAVIYVYCSIHYLIYIHNMNNTIYILTSVIVWIILNMKYNTRIYLPPHKRYIYAYIFTYTYTYTCLFIIRCVLDIVDMCIYMRIDVCHWPITFCRCVK